jgi:hypothetical protein
MPSIYRAQCSNCRFTRHIFDGYVYVGEDGKITGLPHPGEKDALKKIGLTWDGAVVSGGLAKVNKMVCKQCGDLNGIKKIVLPEFAPLNWVGWTAGIIIVPLVFFLLKSHLFLQIIIGTSGISCVAIVYTLLLRHRIKSKDRVSDDLVCQHCGSEGLVPYCDFENQPESRLLCSKCGQRTMEADRDYYALS